MASEREDGMTPSCCLPGYLVLILDYWLKFIHLFHKRLFSTNALPGTILCAGDTAVSRTNRNPYPRGADILVRKTD